MSQAHQRGEREEAVLHTDMLFDEPHRAPQRSSCNPNWPFDAYIVSDMGAVRSSGRLRQRVELHLSTQASCTNRKRRLYRDLGIQRVILGRETRSLISGASRIATPTSNSRSSSMGDVHGLQRPLLLSSHDWAQRQQRRLCTQLSVEVSSRPRGEGAAAILPHRRGGGYTTILSSATSA